MKTRLKPEHKTCKEHIFKYLAKAGEGDRSKFVRIRNFVSIWNYCAMGLGLFDLTDLLSKG